CLVNITEVDVPENRHESEFAQNGQKVFDRAQAAERAGRHTYYSGSLMNVFLEAAVQNVFKQSGRTMVVFRRHNDHPVGSFHRFGKSRVLGCLARIVDDKVECANIDQLCDNAIAFTNFVRDELCGVTAHSALSCCSKNDGNRKGACLTHGVLARRNSELGIKNSALIRSDQSSILNSRFASDGEELYCGAPAEDPPRKSVWPLGRVISRPLALSEPSFDW